MSFNFKDPRKAAVIMCSILLVVCIGLIIAALAAEWNVNILVCIICLAVFATGSILVLLAAFNRKPRFAIMISPIALGLETNTNMSIRM